MSISSRKVVCFGEVLWDVLPSGKYLGGAPLNVALNLKNLELPVTMISAVGDDELGARTFEVLKEKGLPTDFIAWSSLPTGLVQVELDEAGNAEYDIEMPSAWDDISWHPSMRPVVENADVLIFGTLVFRNEISRNTLLKAMQICQGKAIVDLNLREPFYDEFLVDEVLSRADIAKMNEDELQQILQWKKEKMPKEEALPYLAELYGLEMILLSCGGEGAAIWQNGAYQEQPAYQVEVQDTVGAGDGFLAGAVYQFLQDKPAQEILVFANTMGAFIAGRESATPRLEWSKIEDLMGL